MKARCLSDADADMNLEETLDPRDWAALRTLAHRMVDDLIDYHDGLADAPAWQPTDQEARSQLAVGFDEEGVGAEAAYEEFCNFVRPFGHGNIHPRGWGWVNGSGTTIGALAEMWAAGMNPNAYGGEQASPYLEATVIDWLRRRFRFPADASGILVSGGSMANLIGLAAAREQQTKGLASEQGMRELTERLVCYASDQVHNSIDKAIGLLGFGWQNLRKLPCDDNFRLSPGALAEAIAEDRRKGSQPAVVVATVGTVNTGAIDPLQELAALCREEGVWLHVDGAFGALAALAPSLQPIVTGLEQADSLGFDLHKWLHIPIEAGGVLVRHSTWHRRPFSPPAAYLSFLERGVASGPHNFSTLGPQLTRSFRALKVWFSLRAHGTAVYGRLIEQNVRQAQQLAAEVRHASDLELLAPVPLNVVAFRHRFPGCSPEERNENNRELLQRIQESGVAILSGTTLRGSFALRAAFTNHRTRSADLHCVLKLVQVLGEEVKRNERKAT